MSGQNQYVELIGLFDALNQAKKRLQRENLNPLGAFILPPSEHILSYATPEG
jgi:hypothetical protein